MKRQSKGIRNNEPNSVCCPAAKSGPERKWYTSKMTDEACRRVESQRAQKRRARTEMRERDVQGTPQAASKETGDTTLHRWSATQEHPLSSKRHPSTRPPFLNFCLENLSFPKPRAVPSTKRRQKCLRTAALFCASAGCACQQSEFAKI